MSVESGPQLSFQPIDLASGLSDAIHFRRDSYVCSFGDATRFDEAEYIAWLTDKLARDPRLAVHVYDGSERIGQIELGSSRGQPWRGYVNLFYLVPSRRGKGLGLLLEEYASSFLREQGYGSARLSVSVKNPRALRFYQRQGWSDGDALAPSGELRLLEKDLVPHGLRVPALETERLWLRALCELDAPSYERHFVDYEVIRQLARRVPWPYPAGGVLAHLRALSPARDGERWFWGLFRKPEPRECIGAIDLFRPGRPQHRGFWLGRAHWGQGYMTEASAAVNDHAFDQLGFEELIFSNARGNLRSRRIKQKSGARLLGVGPGAYVDPELTEQELWSLSKQAWRALRAQQRSGVAREPARPA